MLRLFRAGLLTALLLDPLFQTADGGTGGGGNADPFAAIKSLDDLPARLKELVNGVVSSRVNEARESATRQAQNTTPEEKAELQRLRDAEKERERKALEAKGEYDRIIDSVKKDADEKLTAAQKETNRARQILRERTVHAEVIAAAAKYNAFNPKQVAKLLEDRIQIDDNYNVVVYDDHGKPALKAGNPLTVDELVSQYLDESPNLRKTSGTEGSGSQGGRTGSPETAEPGKGGSGAADEQVKAAKQEWDALAKIANESKTPADITKAHQAKRRYEKAKQEAQRK
jgi:hypothetical protein